jgi:hypothetical protein
MKQFWFLLIGASALCARTEDAGHPKTLTTIRVTNAIKPHMLEYTFLKIGYSPDQFSVKVNDHELKTGSSLEIPADQKTVRVRYDFSFAKGWRTGAKEIVFELGPDQKEYNLEFSWHNNWRIIAQGAKPQKVKRLKFNG